MLTQLEECAEASIRLRETMIETNQGRTGIEDEEHARNADLNLHFLHLKNKREG
jgi:hypothetical protein